MKPTLTPSVSRSGRSSAPARRPGIHGEVLDLELDLAVVVPFVDGRVEDQRELAAGAWSTWPRSAMFQPMAFKMTSPCRTRSWRWFFWSPTIAGLADDLEPGGDEQRLGVADAVRLEAVELLDDAEAERAEGDLGVHMEDAFESSGVRVSRHRSSKSSREGRDVLAGEFQAGGGRVPAEGRAGVPRSP